MRLVVIARNALGLGDPLIVNSGLQDHPTIKLVDVGAEYFLPRRLVAGNRIAALVIQLGAALGDFLSRNQHVDLVPIEIDAHAIIRPENSKPAADSGLGRGVKYRGRARGARLAAITDARQRGNARGNESRGRLHIHYLSASGVADGS